MWVYPEIRTLGDLPTYHAREMGEKPALLFNGRVRSFSEFDARSNRIANAIRNAGIGQRERIAFIGKNSDHMVEILFGVAKAGCAFVGVNWRLAPAEIAAVIDDAEASLFIIDGDLADLAEKALGEAKADVRKVVFDSAEENPSGLASLLEGAESGHPAVEVLGSDTAVQLYTSGTTGIPKGVELAHEGFNYIRLCEHLEPALDWTDEDVFMWVMPNFHLVGLGLLIQALYNGLTVSVVEQFEPGAVLDQIARDRPTLTILVPTAIQMLLDHPKAKDTDFSSFRQIMYAGSPISLGLIKRALVEMGCPFMQFYGATETSGAATLLRPHEHDLDDENRLKSCGKPLPLTELKILDGEGRECAPGEVGEFVFRSPALFKGYFRKPELTAAVLKDGWYHTGDAGYLGPDGFYYIVDRVKDMIVSGGENIYSAEVEQALNKHPDVVLASVIGVPDPRWQEAVKALVIRKPGATATAEELIAHCRELIAGYKVPKSLEFVEAFPMTPTGKVKKRDLRAQYSNQAG